MLTLSTKIRLQYFIAICCIAWSLFFISILSPEILQKALEFGCELIKIALSGLTACLYWKNRCVFDKNSAYKQIWSFGLFFTLSAFVLSGYNLLTELTIDYLNKWTYNLSWHLTAISGFFGYYILYKQLKNSQK